jgi:hypothetical protein
MMLVCVLVCFLELLYVVVFQTQLFYFLLVVGLGQAASLEF